MKKYSKSIETAKAEILIISLIVANMTAYEIGNTLYREGIPFTSLLIDALPILPRNMCDNVLYSKSSGDIKKKKTEEKTKKQIPKKGDWKALNKKRSNG